MMSLLGKKINRTIRDVPDFPKPGIVFKDISPILHNSYLCENIVDAFFSEAKFIEQIDAVCGMESRGFLFGFPLAMKLEVPFIMVRKEGKLPFDKVRKEYQLEYGSAVIEMHKDSIKPGMKVLIHDDLLATGGTAKAASDLILDMGGEIAGFAFLYGLLELPGYEVLNKISEEIIVLADNREGFPF